MIRWGSGYFLVRGFFSLTGGSLRVDIMRNGPDKKLIVNGCEEKKIAILLNYPGAVVFHPDI